MLVLPSSSKRTIFNNFCNSACLDTPFKDDVLHMYMILPAEFVKILPWRYGEIMLLLDDVGGVCIILVCAHRVILVVLSFMPCASGFRGTFLHSLFLRICVRRLGKSSTPKWRSFLPCFHCSLERCSGYKYIFWLSRVIKLYLLYQDGDIGEKWFLWRPQAPHRSPTFVQIVQP